MVFLNCKFSRGWNINCRPMHSETFAIYSQEKSAAKLVYDFIKETSDKYCFLFRASGLPGELQNIHSECEGLPTYKPYDADKLYIKRFPQLMYQFEKEQLTTILDFWTNSSCERRFIYCVHRDSLDFVSSYFESLSYSELSNGVEIWRHLEFFIENIPEFEYDDAFSFTVKPEYLSKITQMNTRIVNCDELI